MTEDTNSVSLKEFTAGEFKTERAHNEGQFAQIRGEMERDRQSLDAKFQAANKFKETYSARLDALTHGSITRSEIDARFEAQQQKIDLLSKTDWGRLISFAGLAFMLFGAMWGVNVMQIQASVSPVDRGLTQALANISANEKSINDIRGDLNRQIQIVSDAQQTRNREISGLLQAAEVSKTDRTQINDKMHQVETNLANGTAERRANEASFRASLAEIEGQLCSQDNLRNLMHANDLRVMHMLWSKSGLGEYPIGNAFYPEVCNKALYSIK